MVVTRDRADGKSARCGDLTTLWGEGEGNSKDTEGQGGLGQCQERPGVRALLLGAGLGGG